MSGAQCSSYCVAGSVSSRMPHTNCCACTCSCPFVACFVSTDTFCVWGAGGDTTVRVWRASDLSLVRVLRGHRGSVLTLLAVGSVLLSGSRDNTIRYVFVCSWGDVLAAQGLCTGRNRGLRHFLGGNSHQGA